MVSAFLYPTASPGNPDAVGQVAGVGVDDRQSLDQEGAGAVRGDLDGRVPELVGDQHRAVRQGPGADRPGEAADGPGDVTEAVDPEQVPVRAVGYQELASLDAD